MKIDYEIAVEPGQPFAVDGFKPQDAKGIANLFYAVYGADYPFEMYYFPERIIEENRNGNIYSVVARTPKGDVIAHGALYRSSPPYESLYEIGQYLVLKGYRDTFAAFKINQYIGEKLTERIRPEGIFGEAVCNHMATQKSSALIGMKDVALEVGLMPADAYKKEQSAAGRVSCLIQFRSFHDRRHEVFIPPVYQRQIEYILNDLGIDRVLTLSMADVPADSRSEVSAKFFEFAGVARGNVARAGADFDMVMNNFEKQAEKSNIVVLQLFLNLAKPWIGKAVEMLRDRGFFFAGYVPRWFDADGLLLQKLRVMPDFEGAALYSRKAKQIREYVQTDWKLTKT
jgi:hypothetical protein